MATDVQSMGISTRNMGSLRPVQLIALITAPGMIQARAKTEKLWFSLMKPRQIISKYKRRGIITGKLTVKNPKNQRFMPNPPGSKGVSIKTCKTAAKHPRIKAQPPPETSFSGKERQKK